MDASVLINFLRIDRMDLIARHSHDFIVTDHVAAEISDRYPEQRKRFAEAIDATAISQTSVVSPEEMSLFESLSASGRLGAGECSAVAVHRGMFWQSMIAWPQRKHGVSIKRSVSLQRKTSWFP